MAVIVGVESIERDASLLLEVCCSEPLCIKRQNSDSPDSEVVYECAANEPREVLSAFNPRAKGCTKAEIKVEKEKIVKGKMTFEGFTPNKS